MLVLVGWAGLSGILVWIWSACDVWPCCLVGLAGVFGVMLPSLPARCFLPAVRACMFCLLCKRVRDRVRVSAFVRVGVCLCFLRACTCVGVHEVVAVRWRIGVSMVLAMHLARRFVRGRASLSLWVGSCVPVVVPAFVLNQKS